MRVSIFGTLVVACAFASTAWVQAGQDKPAAQKEHTMSGCLQKGTAADTYVVMNTAEKGPKTISIIESKANLAPHVGHKIDITGTGVPNAEAENMKTKPSKGDHYMNITAIKMVSPTCP
ncbi:MAG: hypothetical protein GEU82_12575 [Luteitalea sp.]|nr:hypothetical protein [Luteitalea sp.]